MNVNSKGSNMTSVLLRSTNRALLLNDITGKFLVAALSLSLSFSHTPSFSCFFFSVDNFNVTRECFQCFSFQIVNKYADKSFANLLLFLKPHLLCLKEVLLGICHDLII